MKRLLLPLTALSIIAASCDTETKDSYSTMNFGECNLITSLDDESQPAQISSSIYTMKLNWTKYCVNLSTSDLVVNNQKISFETDTMALKTYYLVSEANEGSYIENGIFSSRANVGTGAEITNLDATFTPGNYVSNSIYVPGVETMASYQGYRLVMGYDLNSRYHVQTFWPICCYMGQSYVVGAETFSTRNTSYRVELNTGKNTARVIIYNPEFTSSDNGVPKAIVVDEVPIKYSTKAYYLEADAPKTTVLGSKDGVVALVETDKYNVTDFSFSLASTDLTEAVITYKIDGMRVTFSGASIVKPSK